jgi:two-component system, LytTR family, response regulator LytT
MNRSPSNIPYLSAHVERSLEAFDHAALDFVPKPIVATRLTNALDRLDAQASGFRRGTLIVRSGGRIDIVDCEHIIRLVMYDGRHLLHDAGLAALEHRLPSDFIRTHRSHIVNAAMVMSVQSTDAGLVAILAHNEMGPISRRRAVDVRRRLLAARGSV